MHRHALIALTVGLLTTVSLPLTAANVAWLDNSAVRLFNEQDWALFRTNVRETLDAAADGETRPWSNPASHASGTATPLRTDTTDGAPCRILRMEQAVKVTTGSSIQRFCQGEDGSWHLANTR